MIFLENRLLADDSHEISYLILFKKQVICCKICHLLQLGLPLKGLMIYFFLFLSVLLFDGKATNVELPEHAKTVLCMTIKQI